MSMLMLAGLGNPGREYQATRHNAGAWWIDALCDHYRATLKASPKLFLSHAEITLENIKLKLVIPTTYMNQSGHAIKLGLDYFNLSPQNLVVAHDDLDLPPGSVRFKTGGGHGGHNGLRDILHHLKTPDFHRLRIGIGHPGNKDDVVDYVLHPPSKSDKKQIETAIGEAVDVLPLLVLQDFQAVMNRLHRFQA